MNKKHDCVPAIYNMICFAFCTEDKCRNCGNGGCTCDVWYNWCENEPSVREAYDTVSKEIREGRKKDRGYDCHQIWKDGDAMRGFIHTHYAELEHFLDLYNADCGPSRLIEEDDPWIAKQKVTLQKVKEYVETELKNK